MSDDSAFQSVGAGFDSPQRLHWIKISERQTKALLRSVKQTVEEAQRKVVEQWRNEMN